MADSEIKPTVFRFKNIFAFLCVLLFILSILTYDKGDLSCLDGGSSQLIANWIGPLGAHISRFFFYAFGVATYPVVFLLLLCTVRSFIPVKTNRKGYFLCLGMMILGLSVLFGLFPAEFVQTTESLGIGHAKEPALALSGGVIGSYLAAPETAVFAPGLIRGCIGMVGTLICALVFLISGTVFLFLADWKEVFVLLLKRTAQLQTTSFALEDEEKTCVPERPVQKKAEVIPAAANSVPVETTEQETPPPPRNVSVPEDRQEKDVSFENRIPGNMTPGEDPEEEPVPETQPQSVSGAVVMPSRPAEERNPEDDPYSQTQKSQVTVSNRTNRQQAMNTEMDRPYELPSIYLLDKPKEVRGEDADHLDTAKAILQSTLDSFDINGRVADTIIGPRITRFEISLEPGVRVEKVTSIQNNIAKDMRAESIRILAPVPGKDTVGIELPNKVSNMVVLRELMESDAWRNTKATIPIILGKDVAGKVMIADLAKAPHLLIAGSTGSGKSVCMNTLIMSLLYRFSPFDMKLILVDPKYVELVIYSPLPHLITPVVNDPTKVPYALRWGVNEMEHRYQVMAKVKAKNLEAFNSRGPDPEGTVDENGDPIPPKLPLLIIIIDELADIMMTEAKKDVETSICRIAQKGRAAGIHLVIATQTPRKDIITGVIKANLPTKIAFKVSNGVDSRVILDSLGAEKLLGKGDMLFKGPAGEMERIQGSMVSDPEIQKVADFVSDQVPQHFDTTVVLENPEEAGEEVEDGINSFPDFTPEEEDSDPGNDFIKATVAKYIQPGDDENVRKALEIILRENKVSTSYLQRRMGIGYNKSAEIIDKLEQRGIVSPPLAGGQKRTILIFDELNKPDNV